MKETIINLRLCSIGLLPITFPISVLYENKNNHLVVIDAFSALPKYAELINPRLNFIDLEALINSNENLKVAA